MKSAIGRQKSNDNKSNSSKMQSSMDAFGAMRIGQWFSPFCY